MLWNGHHVSQRFVLRASCILPRADHSRSKSAPNHLVLSHVISDDVALLFRSVTCPASVMAGLALGGVWGLREGARKPLAVTNARLRINAILNAVTRRGTFVGNSAGVLGECRLHALLLFVSAHATVHSARVQRCKLDH